MRNQFTAILILLFSMGLKAQIDPGAVIVTTTSLFCTDVPITYSVNSTAENVSYLWSVVPAKGLSSHSELNRPHVTLTFSGSATYSVFLTISNSSGETQVLNTSIKPNRSARASFNAQLNSAGYPVQLSLTNYSTYSLKNYWKFSDNTVDSSFHAVKGYPVSGSYSVTLIAYGVNGCNDSSSYHFRVSDSSSITLPNIFTPNGDGVNDVYTPITRGISGLNAWVYSRTGVLVSNWDKPKGGWDGYSTSGELCSDGVYFIIVDAFGFDGKIYKLKGTITLIR